jgi:alpha-L-arabinofuranosidase
MFSRNRGDVVLRSDIRVEDIPPEPLPPRNGKIGVGTWNTQSEYKNIRVTRNGKVLYASDFESNAKGWVPVSGNWKLEDGALRQSGEGSNRQAIFGDSTWSDYTITLKARKLGGVEGFIVLFSVKDKDTFTWWNVGGWGNTKHAIEVAEDGGKSVMGKEVPGSVETGRWYDIKIDLNGQQIKCYLDGRLVEEVTYEANPMKPLHAVVSRASANADIILKVVNVSKMNFDTQISLDGVGSVAPKGDAVVLTSNDPLDENSISNPTKVIPNIMTVEGISKDFHYSFPANSVTVLRLKATQ